MSVSNPFLNLENCERISRRELGRPGNSNDQSGQAGSIARTAHENQWEEHLIGKFGSDW